MKSNPKKSAKSSRGGRARAVVLVSGGGTTMQEMIDRSESGRLNVEIVGVISSRPGVKALDRAAKHNIPSKVVARADFKKYGEREDARFNQALGRAISGFEPDLVILAGFMTKIGSSIVHRYWGRMLNTHPGLIPSFCGQGMFGDRVHAAAVEYGVKLSGCTIHFVDEHYDHGPILAQKAVPVKPDDTAETLGARVRGVERKLYCEAIQLLATGRVELDGRKVRVLPEVKSPGKKKK